MANVFQNLFSLDRPARAGSLMNVLGAPSHQEVQASQAADAKRQQAQLSAAQMVLENPNASEQSVQAATAVMQRFGMGALAQGMRPGPQREKLGARQRLIEFDEQGKPRVTVDVVEDPQETRDMFGKSMSGRATDIAIRAAQKVRQGQALSEIEKDELAFARQVLTQPRVVQGPGGELVQLEPMGIPPRLQQVFSQTRPSLGTTRGGEQVERVSDQVADKRYKVTPLRAGEDTFQKDFDNVLGAAEEISTILTEGRSEVGGVTGAVGTAKAIFGGAARQVGIPVTGRSKQLKRKLEIVKALAARHILGERGRTISNADRERLDQIVGTMDVLTDEQDIREALYEVIQIMSRMQ